jgi:hypothetical protein
VATDNTAILNDYKKLVSSIGRAAIHTLFPKDFEYFMFALELTDYDGATIDYFTWPIMPSSISKNENNRINVKKTYAGVTVINSKSFTPSELTIKGSFGRSFKILIEAGTPSIFKAFQFSRQNGVWDTSDLDQSKLKEESRNYNPVVKTGYGCIQILKSIINKSAGCDDKGRPFKLYAYNLSMGESYLVAPSPNPLVITLNDSNQNMIPNYTLNLITLAPISGTKTQGDTGSGLSNVLGLDVAQKATSTFVSTLRSIV